MAFVIVDGKITQTLANVASKSSSIDLKKKLAELAVPSVKDALTRYVGAIGDVPFFVSSSKVQSFASVTWNGSANVSEHKRLNGNALTQPTGLSADNMKIEIYLSSALGIDPQDAIAKLFAMKRAFTPVTVVLGEKTYGKYKWLIKDVSVSMEQFDVNGNLATAKVSVSIIEYLRG